MADDRPLILLTGATGTIGSKVIHGLTGRARVRVLVHNDHVARRYQTVERVAGDLRDPDSLVAAFDQVDRLFLLTPSVADQQLLEDNALNAALNAGVRRIVYLSSTDVRWDLRLSAVHRATERALLEHRVEHTALRAEYLLDNLLLEIDDLMDGRLVAPAGIMRCPFLDARDAGAVAAAALLSATPIRGPLELTGPRALTWAKLAERLGWTLGRPIEHIDPEPEEWACAAIDAGMDPWLASALKEYFTALRGEDLQASGEVLRVTHRSPRSVETFAREVMLTAVRRRVAAPVRTAGRDEDPDPIEEAACLKQ
jgi:uncharacterized protein YbjT (DUF2867 family)